MKKFNLGFAIALLLHLLGCFKEPMGKLVVNAPREGEFEIFKVSGAFISRQKGLFNSPSSLTPGKYFLLSDCSSVFVTITPNHTSELVAHMLEFHPPDRRDPEDVFTVQCARQTHGYAPQQIVNRFHLFVLGGDSHELLVGTNAINVELSEATHPSPQIFSFPLAALTVESPAAIGDDSKTAWSETKYYVSSAMDERAITQGMKLNQRLLLIPHRYIVAINGTETTVELQEGEVKSIKPATLLFKSPSDTDFDGYRKIKGNPYLVTVNGASVFAPNIEHVVLPGTWSFQLPDALVNDVVTVAAEEKKIVSLYGLKVALDCAPWEWECLGSKHVNVYAGEDTKPIIKTITDIPILYSNENISLEMESTTGLFVKVPKPIQPDISTILNVGEVKIVSTDVLSHVVTTDVIRIESVGPAGKGYSYDVPRVTTTNYSLIEGSYVLGTYNASVGAKQMGRHTPFKIARGTKLAFAVQYLTPQPKKPNPRLSKNRESADLTKLLE